MGYQCVATSVAGFIQQLAVGYIARGYYFYVQGRIPCDKDPTRTDAKILSQYGISMSKWTRARRKRGGAASVQYLRYRHEYVIVATHGDHPFFESEGRQLRDVRIQPIHFMGYSIGCRKGRSEETLHVSVRIAQDCYRDLKARLEKLAVQRSVDQLREVLAKVPFEPYAPVRDQLKGLLRAINRRRKAAGQELIHPDVVVRRRAPVKPFAPWHVPPDIRVGRSVTCRNSQAPATIRNPCCVPGSGVRR